MPLNQSFPGHSALATFADIRRDLEGSVVRDAAGKMRAGVFPAHFSALVTGRSDMKVAIADFRAVIDRGGAIFMANVGADTSVTLDAAPAANRRIDLIYAIQRSTTLGDAASLPIFGFVKGTASATPVAPSLPANLSTALPLATVEIPAGATTTLSAGVVITQVFPYTAMAGGTVVVRNSIELAAWTPANGSGAYCVADGSTCQRVGGAWQRTEERTVTFAPSGASSAVAPIYYQDFTPVTFLTPFSVTPKLWVQLTSPWGSVQWHQVTGESATGFTHRGIRAGAQPDVTGARLHYRAVGLA